MIAIETDAVSSLLERITGGKTRYICHFHVQIAWPQIVVHGNGHFYKTGKEGLRRKDGCPTAEYEASKGRRLWLGLDGEIAED